MPCVTSSLSANWDRRRTRSYQRHSAISSVINYPLTLEGQWLLELCYGCFNNLDCRVSVVFFDKPGYEIGTRGTTLQQT